MICIVLCAMYAAPRSWRAFCIVDRKVCARNAPRPTPATQFAPSATEHPALDVREVPFLPRSLHRRRRGVFARCAPRAIPAMPEDSQACLQMHEQRQNPASYRSVSARAPAHKKRQPPKTFPIAITVVDRSYSRLEWSKSPTVDSFRCAPLRYRPIVKLLTCYSV